MPTFDTRVADLPALGLGVSTEYGAFQGQTDRDGPPGLDLDALLRDHPRFAGFLEVGVEVAKGLDDDARAWASRGGRTTYHFLDVNLDEPEDLDPAWLGRVRQHIETLDPAWLCGDAGLWHFGPRERGQMLLLPPILTRDAADAMARGVAALRDATGLEVLPENPPGHVFLGDLHLCEFFARVAEAADTGLLVDCAHLAIYQRVMGYDPLTALDALPMDRIVEVHVAGATLSEVDGLLLVEDDHTPDVLPETWTIFEAIAERATNLRAVVFECERNPLEACLPGFERLERTLAAADSPALWVRR